MPRFKSTEEAVSRHKEYNIDTDEEGKYNRGDIYAIQKNRLDFLLSGIPDDSYVLEVGCNSGGLFRVLSNEKKCYCKGIDISEEMVKRCNAKGFSAVVGRAEELPYKDNTFDVVVMTEVLEHIHKPEIALSEAHRVLKPGGVFVGSVPHPKGENVRRKGVEDHRWHCHVFQRKLLAELLRKFYKEVYTENITWYNDLENQPQWIGWICKKED